MHNNKWTHNEEKDLVLKLRGGAQMKDIAELSGRSYGAIKERLKKIIYENIKNIDNNDEVHKVSKYLNLDTELIKKYYTAYGGRLEGMIKQESIKQEQINQEQIKQSGGTNMTIKRQNEMLEDIIKNHDLKKKIGKLIKTKQLDKDSKEVLKKILFNIKN